ncbi:MAG: hypothetical protein RML15_06720 [Bacteroidota bacterium]|nr:hypothetical protein [Bacteroidota bacterium]
MNIGRAEFCALLTPDTNVVVISGISGRVNTTGGSGIHTPTVEFYNRRTNHWQIIGNLLIARRQHTACWVSDEEILIVGGRTQDLTTIPTAEIFNIRTGQSRFTTDFPYPMTDLVSTTSSQGKMCVFGGRTGGANSYRTDTVFSFNLRTNRWEYFARLGTALKAPTVVKLSNNGFCAIGGEISESPTKTSREVSIESSGTISSWSLLQEGRKWHGAAQWSDDTILVGGGYSDANRALSTCEWIDLRKLQSFSAPPLNIARGYPVFVSMKHPVTLSPVIVAISGFDSTNRNTPTIEVLEQECSAATVQISGARPLCSGDTITITASPGFAYYRWAHGDTTPTTCISRPGRYSLTVTDSAGCTSTTSVDIPAAVQLELQWRGQRPARVHPGMLHCDSLELVNPSDTAVVVERLPLRWGVEWSVPGHWLPLVVPARQRRVVPVCWYGEWSGRYRDEVCVETACGERCVEVVVEAEALGWCAESRCGVVVGSHEVRSLAVVRGEQVPVTGGVEVRDVVGRRWEVMRSGEAEAVIETASLPPGVYVATLNGMPTLLLLVH